MKTILVFSAMVLVAGSHFGCGKSGLTFRPVSADGPSPANDGPFAQGGQGGTRAESGGGSGGMVGSGGTLCSAGLCGTVIDGLGGSDAAGGGSGDGTIPGAGGATGSGGTFSAIVDASVVVDASAPIDTSAGACLRDSDCEIRATGCCGSCAAVGDPFAPTFPCSSACAARVTTCACVNGRCATGTLALNSSCETTRDRCGLGTKCCAACAPTDGASMCESSVCTKAVFPTFLDIRCP